MRAVVQRVRDAEVRVDGIVSGRTDSGLLVYLGVGEGDGRSDADYLAEKISGLRIFTDGEGKMNLSVSDLGGGILVVSQFTLMADTRKGKRPSYSSAADPEAAKELYEYFIQALKGRGIPTQTGVFQASMRVSYTNEGPVTILLDSKKTF